MLAYKYKCPEMVDRELRPIFHTSTLKRSSFVTLHHVIIGFKGPNFLLRHEALPMPATHHEPQMLAWGASETSAQTKHEPHKPHGLSLVAQMSWKKFPVDRRHVQRQRLKQSFKTAVALDRQSLSGTGRLINAFIIEDSPPKKTHWFWGNYTI